MVSFASLLVTCAAVAGVSAIPGKFNALTRRSGTASGTGYDNGDYYYYYFTDGVDNATFTDKGGGEYSLVWSGAGHVIGGKGWNPGSAKPITFNGSFSTTGTGSGSLSVYGHTINPVTEYSIVENYGTLDPSTGATHKGTFASDGSTYDIYLDVRVNQPSVIGTTTFNSYWSVRSSKRSSGTITTANHFNAWAALGLTLGTPTDQIVATEGYDCSGSSDITVSSGTTISTTAVSTTSTTTASSSGGTCAALYGQCGGLYWTGATCCSSGTCTLGNAYYYECL
ncbi:hypothetical protein FRB93_005526 [Tulasnella sp. JGI-2019a]|nr:hypothetical protein FRB93_005526 [Tulasnella sp. JGI-2019a]